MNIRFECPACKCPGRLEKPGPAEWQCPRCDHLLKVAAPAADHLDTCAVCGNREFYKKEDFPHWLGMSLLTAACLVFLGAEYFYLQGLAWAVLIGSALFDGLLYLRVGDVVVCYRCNAHYRNFPPNEGHKPFELSSAERYRQERLRREQVQTAKGVESGKMTEQ